MATFQGTNGKDVADAANGTLTGFTGGTVDQLQDAEGDTFIGLDGDDRITGGYGDDVLRGGRGADRLTGFDGNDLIDFDGEFGGVFINLFTGRGYNNAAEGDLYLGVENVRGTSFADFVIGNSVANRIEGQGGDDRLIGALGADLLYGGDGIDTASYEENYGGVFVSLLAARGYGNAAEGDLLFSIENLVGGIYSDYFIGDNGANRLEGAAGDDTLIGAGGADALIGGTGIDTASYIDNAGAVTVDLATGIGSGAAAQGDTFDSIENLYGTGYGDTFYGDANDNRLDGGDGDGADRLFGRGGADVLIGGAGDDILDGGDGDDRLEGGIGSDQLAGGAGNDILIGGDGTTSDQLNILDGGDGNDTLRAGFNGRLFGGAGIDDLIGGAGDDVLDGGAGGDRLDGGSSGTRDRVSYLSSTSGLTLDFVAGTFTGDAVGDTYFNVEEFEGSNFADTMISGAGADTFDGAGGDDVLTGNGGNDRLFGGDGNNTLSGGDGNDVLTAGVGNSRLDGGAGDDTLSVSGGNHLLIGGAGADYMGRTTGFATVDYSASSAGVRIVFRFGGRNGFGGDAQGDVYTAVDAFIGSAFNDTFLLNGQSRVDGAGGDDFFFAFTGAETLIGGSGTDTVSYIYPGAGTTLSVTVNLATGTGTGNNAQGDTYTGIENVIGSSGNDVIIGDANANVLAGYTGPDRLTGGGGADQFRLEPASTGVDTITDFTTGVDKILLGTTAYGNLPVGGLSADAFGTGAATTASQRILYNTATGELSFDQDGSGAGQAVVFAVLEGAPAISAADIAIIPDFVFPT